jgi:hypothetical protein
LYFLIKYPTRVIRLSLPPTVNKPLASLPIAIDLNLNKENDL